MVLHQRQSRGHADLALRIVQRPEERQPDLITSKLGKQGGGSAASGLAGALYVMIEAWLQQRACEMGNRKATEGPQWLYGSLAGHVVIETLDEPGDRARIA
jgi:hypothetical protein